MRWQICENETSISAKNEKNDLPFSHLFPVLPNGHKHRIVFSLLSHTPSTPQSKRHGSLWEIGTKQRKRKIDVKTFYIRSNPILKYIIEPNGDKLKIAKTDEYNSMKYEHRSTFYLR